MSVAIENVKLCNEICDKIQEKMRQKMDLDRTSDGLAYRILPDSAMQRVESVKICDSIRNIS